MSLFRPASRVAASVSILSLAFSAAAFAADGDGVRYDDASRATATLEGENGTQIKNVAAGTDSTDAVNVAQMENRDSQVLAAARKMFEGAQDLAGAGDAATLTASKAYTDTTATQALNSAKAYTDAKFAAWTDTFAQYRQQADARFAHTDRRIDRIGAMGSAMTHMAVNAANGTSAKGRIAIGIGA